MMNDYEKSQNYKIMDTLFSSQRDFIVIGLCGLTGSGSTEVARILQTDFAELGLPQPNSCSSDVLVDDGCGNTVSCYNSSELMQARHEYRMLYTFAEKNWNRFSRIKVSALITARALGEEHEDFCSFLESFMSNLDSTKKEKLTNSCQNFF